MTRSEYAEASAIQEKALAELRETVRKTTEELVKQADAANAETLRLIAEWEEKNKGGE